MSDSLFECFASFNERPQRLEWIWHAGLVQLGSNAGPPTGVESTRRTRSPWEPARPFRDGRWVGTCAVIVEEGMAPTIGMASDGDLPEIVLAAILDLDEKLGREFRPARIEVDEPGVAADIRDLLGAAGVLVVEVAKAPPLETVRNRAIELERRIQFGDVLGTAADSDGTIETARSRESLDARHEFAESVRAFIVSGVARGFDVSDLVAIESPEGPESMRLTVIDGSDRTPRGVWFFEKFEEFAQLLERRRTFEGDEPASWCIRLGGIGNMPKALAEEWIGERWPVAHDNAFPLFVRGVDDRTLDFADDDRLRFASGVLRALASSTRREILSGEWSVPVEPGSAGEEHRFTMPVLRRRLSELEKSEPSTSILSPRVRAANLAAQARGNDGCFRSWLLDRALELDPECIEGLRLSALGQEVPCERKAGLERAVGAGTRKLSDLLAEHVPASGSSAEVDAFAMALVNLAEECLEDGEWARGEELLRRAIAIDPEDECDAGLKLFGELIERDRVDDMLSLLERLAPRSDYFRYFLALAHFARGHSHESWHANASPSADRALQSARRANPRVLEHLIVIASDEDDSLEAGHQRFLANKHDPSYMTADRLSVLASEIFDFIEPESLIKWLEGHRRTPLRTFKERKPKKARR